jgi:hypothetical protein
VDIPNISLFSHFSLVRNYSIITSPYDEMYDKFEDITDVPFYTSEQHGLEGRFKYVLIRGVDDARLEDAGKVNYS